MKKYKIKSVPSKHGAFIRGRIDKSRRRAGIVGLAYLFSLVALIAVTCLGLLTSEFAAVTPKAAFDAISSQDFGTWRSIVSIKFCSAVLYLGSLLVAVICVLNALTHLKNLFKKKVSRIYGLNANIDAMDSIGNMFSLGFACILVCHLIIYAFCGITVTMSTFGYVLLGFGFAVHFVCGFCGGKVSVFYIDEDTGVSECKRPYGRIIPLIRNVLQFIAIVVIGYLFLKGNSIYATIKAADLNSGTKLLTANTSLLPVILDGLMVIWLSGMILHAVSSSEFSIEGPYASGIRNFRIFSCLLFLTSVVSVLWQNFIGTTVFAEGTYVMTVKKMIDVPTALIAIFALVSYLLDMLLKLRWTKEAIEESEIEDRPIIPNINITTPKQPINIQVPELKVPELVVHMPAPKAAELPPINIHMPAAQKQVAPAPINVTMPNAQRQVAPAPISVNVPAAQKQVAPAPINVVMPNAQRQVAPAPISVNVPAAQKQVAPAPINVVMPNAQRQVAPAPISVNVPAAQKQVAPAPINVVMPNAQRQVAPAPISVNVPAAQKQVAPAPINVVMPNAQRQVAPAPISVNVPAAQKQVAPAPINVVMPNAQRQVAPAPISVNVPAAQKQVAPAPINVVMPNAQRQVAPAPISVNVPAAQKQVAPAPINVVMPNAQRQVAPAPINVNMPNAQRQVAPAPINVMLPNNQRPVTPTPISVNVPASAPAPAPMVVSNAPMMPNMATPMGAAMEGVNGADGLNPMMMPMMPPLMTMNPMTQPYPMHMNMPMVENEPTDIAALKESLKRELKEELMAQIMEEMMMAAEYEKAPEQPAKTEEKEEPKQAVAEAKEEPAKVEEEKDSDVNVTPIVAPIIASDDEEEEEEVDPITEQEWEVTCPSCSKPVKTQTGSLYHRCPSCQKVFELQKQTKVIEDGAEQEMIEDASFEADENNE